MNGRKVLRSQEDCTKSEQTMMCLSRETLEGWRITSKYMNVIVIKISLS